MAGILNKSGIATQLVARALCGVEVGERIPTVADLVESCGVVRGNVQKTLSNLKESGAVSLEAHGQNGTTLLSIDYEAIAAACGVNHLVGVMPLPYTGRYEGLATGLFTLMGKTTVRSYISFMRGSEARVQSMLDGFADYCTMSRLAYTDCASRGMELEVALDCGPHSYVERHVLLLRNDGTRQADIRRVGIDGTSADQRLLTLNFFSDREVEYVPIQYTQIVAALKSGIIDAGIWNEDDLHLNEEGLREETLDSGNMHADDAARAVIAVRKGDALTKHLIRELIDVNELSSIQHEVMSGEIPARY